MHAPWLLLRLVMDSARSPLFGSIFALVAAFAVPAALVLSAPVTAQAQAQDPGKFVQELGDKAIAQLAGKSIPEEEERTRFKALLTQYFDVNAIGKFTVGRAYWGSASPAQRQEFLSLYETQVTNAYAKRFQNYEGEQFKVIGQQKESDLDTIVNSEISRPNGGPPVPVLWRVRAENSTFKIADVTIAGISMAVTDRQQFAAVIERGGGNIQALIDALKTQNMVPASTKS
ncbi:MAG TPA: ABC transporter substrate-binding protein [Alphaproteobacteria bacterium]|nr:ABC transporter substrate-binding protein [Alphaproteobacteria bacterium]